MFGQVFIDEHVIMVFKNPELVGGIRQDNFRVSPIDQVFFEKVPDFVADVGVGEIRRQFQAFKGQEFFECQGRNGQFQGVAGKR